MMGLAKMAPDGWRYYAEEVGLGREDYFAGHGEEPGRWAGPRRRGPRPAGTVSPEQLSRLFGEGRHPVTGAALGRPFAGQSGLKTVPDRAKTGRAGLGRWPVTRSVSRPRRASRCCGRWPTKLSRPRSGRPTTPPSAAALEFLQDHAAFTRRGHAGAVQADTDGYVAAAFTHRTSRAGDPQLHTHVLVSAKVRASSDGALVGARRQGTV